MSYTKCTKCLGSGEIPSPQDLIQIRKAAGLTTREMADRLGVTPTYIRMVEAGQSLSPKMLLGYMEIRASRKIVVSPAWARDELGLMIRISEVVAGVGHCPEKQDAGYDWRLDDHNDWWATLQGRELIVAHRLGGRRLAAAKAFLRIELA